MKPVPVIATAASVLLVAACGANTSSATSPDTANSALLAFARCMRAHQVPNFPDPLPTGNTKFPSAQQLRVSSSQYQVAENACQYLLPAGANDSYPAAEIPQLLAGMRSFAGCMRSHGVPDWPDPTLTSQGHPVFELVGLPGLDTHDFAPQINTALNECGHLMPAQMGGVPVDR